MSGNLAASDVRAILLDIEGTTTPISFVYDVLFPFARNHVKEFLESHFDEAPVSQDVGLLRREHESDEKSAPPLLFGSRTEEIESLCAYVEWLIDQDRKSTGLKSLQGRIWQQGYQDLILRAQVFDDVPGSLERWRKAGITLAIFSSGSVLAQKLLFAHTTQGDLSGYFQGFFDTTTGSKTDQKSYASIAAHLHFAPPAVLFISDVVAELDAAAQAGMKTLLCVRPGNHPQPTTQRYTTVESFDEIRLPSLY